MTSFTVSVVIVSRGRPQVLKRCLMGISQLQYDGFEVIVVADPQGISAVSTLAFADNVKLVPFDQPNVSAARNLGVAHAAGDIVAFTDDDAVPEPTWLRYLVAPASQPDVAAMGGFVRGRNGISFQWRANSLDAFGQTHPFEIEDDLAKVLHPSEGVATKTEGTNMAFRRDVLIELGGFDTAYQYFLDETDLNIRLAKAGYATALVPLAQVHHGFAANRMRQSNRVPRDLFDIGASWAVFQRKHLREGDHVAHWAGIRAHQRHRVLGHMVSGGLEPRSVRTLMRRLDEGYAEGQTRRSQGGDFSAGTVPVFKPFPFTPRRSVAMSARPLNLKKKRQIAQRKVEENQIITIISLSLTAMHHSVRFTELGVWEQVGGLFGRSIRTEPLIQIVSRPVRVEKERRRVASQRGFVE